jgi:acetoin utilization deacetylase AcuC-like enzyme
MRPLARALRRLRPKRLWFVHHPGYAQTIPRIPLDPKRGERVLTFLRDEGLVGRGSVLTPHPASLRQILRVHTSEYVASLDRVEVVSRAVGVPLTEGERQRAVEQQRLVTGGTVEAVLLALRTGHAVVNLGGGLHHATPTHGMGFCLINDVAIAIVEARDRGFDQPVLVVDLDLHDGNGTRAAFQDDPSVHTFSIHNQHWEPQGGVASTAIALGTGIGDDELLTAARNALPPVLADVRPGLVVYVAGTDVGEDDRLGDWRMTAAGILARDRLVVDLVRRQGPALPLVVVLAGGYGRGAWRYSARFLAWVAGGHVLEPPDELELKLRAYRKTALRVANGDDWGLTEADLFAVVPSAGPPPRVLGLLSRLAVEMSLEEVGILDRVRGLGFPKPALEIAFGGDVGDTITLLDGGDARALLMELRVSRNRRMLPGMELLYVEWLRLQNPRMPFGPTQPRLPGQNHPSLGLLREVVAWIVLLAERLGLDGVASTSSQYYMAVLGRHDLQFVDPAAGARFDAMYGLLRGMPLADAEHMLAEGRVVDVTTGAAVYWEPAVTVFPVSGRLRQRLASAQITTPRAPVLQLVPG